MKMKKKFYASLAALVVVLSGILTFNIFNGESLAALPRDCDSNSIINCGAVNQGELTSKYKANATGDLPAIYNHYGISSGMIAAGAPMGEVHKDGRVTLNGETVATGASSIGRKNIFSGSTTMNIGGRTYYNTPNSRAFASESIAAYIFLDKNGEFIAAILTSCGNPVSAVKVPKKPAPAYKCDGLAATDISREEYRFTAAASASNGATISGYTFDFGDGKTQTSTGKTISHTYDKPGEYTAKVTANVTVDGQAKTATGPQCQVKVTVSKNPTYKCTSLTARTIKLEDRSYAFDLTYDVTGGASLVSVDYQFGDGQGRENVSAEEAKSVTHSYAKAGTYTTTATLHFSIGGKVVDEKCEVSISTSPEVCALNPSLPKDDERCAPCPIPGKEQFPKDSPECVTPPVAELPHTGPMDFVGAGLGLGSLVAAGYYWYVSRRSLLSAWLER